MKEHGVAVTEIVLANPARLTVAQREQLVTAAGKEGVALDQSGVFDRAFFASRLRRDGYWRHELLDLTADPISLSREAPELAESPWAHLPLAEREGEVTLMCSIAADTVLCGRPGLGKSRLLQEIEGVVFVDKDADFTQVADDLRWVMPTTVVVDDAGQSEQLLRRLVSMRRAEPDICKFRLIATCWPDEADLVKGALVEPEVVVLDPLERKSIDDLIVSMGITGQVARAEILNQAEGRPGWAVALGDLLLRGNDSESLLSGRALYGEVTTFLQRRGAQAGTIDLLAMVAALREITDDDLDLLAAELGETRPHVAAILGRAAQSGLVDVEVRYSWDNQREFRVYRVRPPLLASVLVAELAFGVLPPVVDLDRLLARWPTRLFDLTRTAIDAAALSTSAARALADDLLERALTSGDLRTDQLASLLERYARLDARAGERVLEVCRHAFTEAVESNAADGWALEPLVGLASLVARWYQLEAAIAFLLDACLWDFRATNPNPGHPRRQITDLVHNFHPELPLPTELRYRVAQSANAWLALDPSDGARCEIHAEIVGALLSLNLRAAHSHPGNPLRFQLVETVVPPAEIERMFDELWPTVRELITAENQDLVRAVIDATAGWLRIGGGYDRPFGQSHPDDSIAQARHLGEALVHELASLDLGLGGLVRLRSTAVFHGIEADIAMPDDWEPFLRDIERGGDLMSSQDDVIADVRQQAGPWAAESPEEVVGRLLYLKAAIDMANLRWPDRIWAAAEAIAAAVADPELWLDAALTEGLLPEATAFARRCLEGGKLRPEHLDRLLDAAPTRGEAIAMVLSTPHSPAWSVHLVEGAIRPSDYRTFELIMLRRLLSPDAIKSLLAAVDESTRGMLALAIYQGRDREGGLDLTDIEAEWLEALSHFRVLDVPGAADYHVAELFSCLGASHPLELAVLVRATLAEASSGEVYTALTRTSWDLLANLPMEQKLMLWTHFSNSATVSWLLGQHLAGNDIAWLETMLDAGAMTPQDALATHSGLDGPQPSIEDLARLLVPRGIDPNRVAGLAHAGGWVGNRSDRYQGLIERFAGMAGNEDQSVRAVGEAGVAIFASARDEALRDEKQQRIRGER